jgi:GTP-binding protein
VRIESVELRATVARREDGPQEPFPQVAFVGRSNVGKSSLLNALLGTRLAAVSKEPGKTKTINFYLVNRHFFFVDLPGYGWSRTATSQRRTWGTTITDYLVSEERLRLVVGLIDPRIPTSPLDVDLVRLVQGTGKSLVLVMTKADKLGRNALAQAATRLVHDLGIEHRPLTFSATTREGSRELLAAIAPALVDAVRN